MIRNIGTKPGKEGRVTDFVGGWKDFFLRLQIESPAPSIPPLRATPKNTPKQPWMMVRQLHKRLSVAGTVENLMLFFFFFLLFTKTPNPKRWNCKQSSPS